MEWMGISEEVFYSSKVSIVPMDFYYPGKSKTGDLPPRKFIAEDYHPEILSMMPEIRMTILIGQYAMKHYLAGAMRQNLTETVRSYESYIPDFFPIVHPSPLNFRWLKKNPWFEEQVIPDLQKLIRERI